MNGPSPSEILEALRAIDEAAEAGLPCLLATMITSDGSVYSRAGAAAVIVNGDLRGSIPLAELEGPFAAQCAATLAEGKPRLYEGALAEDDPVLGYGLGYPGRVEIFLEPAAAVGAALRPLREALLRGEPVVCSLQLSGKNPGQRGILPADSEEARECFQQGSPELVERVAGGKVERRFLCPIEPMGKVIVFGSSPAALTLCRQLADLGLFVYVADPRPGRLARAERRRSERVAMIEGGWEQARAAANPDENTAVVVMTRSYALDLETLQGALQSPARYVGLTGPRKRAERMLAELKSLGVEPRNGVFFAPAGLDLGAESTGERALSIAAEILSSRNGLSLGRGPLRERRGQERRGVPGLILAAGRGKRFSGGSKLCAPIYGKPVLRHAVENALASKLDPVIVVLGCEAEQALKALEGLDDPRLRVVFNPRWKGGKASSIEVGLREAPFGSPGVISLLGDMPFVPAWLIDRVISEFELSGRLTFPVYPGAKGMEKGYPTAFPRELFGEIRALTGDDTAMEAVRSHWAEAIRIPLDDASTQADVDTKEDLQLLLAAPPEPRETHRV